MQRLSIARAFLKNAPILILDEATSSIDTETEIVLQEGLSHLLEGRTSFIIAHRLSTIKNANRIMYVADGKILESGSHEELLQMHGNIMNCLCRSIRHNKMVTCMLLQVTVLLFTL